VDFAFLTGGPSSLINDAIEGVAEARCVVGFDVTELPLEGPDDRGIGSNGG
jgi:hypothetical protein